MPRWTVSTGVNDDDIIVIERTGADVTIDIPSRKTLRTNRAAVEDLRRKLGAAIADEDGEPDVAG